MKKKQGFTLIELLIVVAIIGLLATMAIIGLTTANQRARDSKRVADVKAIVSALELYWNDNAGYPLLNNAVVGDIDTWGELNTALTAYVNQLPTDPYAQDTPKSATYFYTYLMDTSTSNKYYVGARLETASQQSLSQDIDTASAGGANYKSVTSRDTFNGSSAALNCTDPTYCLYGDATF
jgi:type II secretion system protein G